MAPIDWFARMAAAAARIDRAEAAADKAARALARVSRPETVRKYERQGKAAETRRRAAERDFREAERRLSAPKRTGKKPAPRPLLRPSVPFLVTVDYRGRRGHRRYVEFVLYGPAGSTATDVRRAVNKYAQRREPEGWTYTALRYGQTQSSMTTGRVTDLSELSGLLMQERSITIGELNDE